MTQPLIEIRPCLVQDIAGVLALWARASAVPRSTDQPDALRKRLERDPELFLLAWDGQRLIGSLMGGWDGWRGNMYRLVVDPEYRRGGVARRLVERVEAALRQLGAKRITSLVFKDDPRASTFWRRASYRPDSATERHAKELI